MNWKASQWMIDGNRSGLVDPLITITEGMYIVRYGNAVLSKKTFDWVTKPDSAVQAREIDCLCETLIEAQQLYMDWELMFMASKAP